MIHEPPTNETAAMMARWVVDRVTPHATWTVDDATATTIAMTRGATTFDGRNRVVMTTRVGVSVTDRRVVDPAAVPSTVVDMWRDALGGLIIAAQLRAAS
jgi:hypothetical protein